jgi:hypothetical protein
MPGIKGQFPYIVRIAALWVCAGLIAGAGSVRGAADRTVIGYDRAIPQAAFAAAEIQRALVGKGYAGVELDLDAAVTAESPVRILLVTGPGDKAQETVRALGVTPAKSAGWQAYSIRRKNEDGHATYAVIAATPEGVLYGGLDLAEAVRLGTLADLKDSDHAPYIERRGIKFNIPLDLRTPSYSDSSDAFQQNIPEMWSMDFWREFLDEMARHRYNALTLWNLHPFPSIVKVPEFPDVALDDVWRTTMKLDNNFSHSASDMVKPAMLKSYEIVKKLTIDEKIQFWRDVMRHARDRGIETYWFTWNTFVWGAQDAKYGITTALDNQTTIDYFRASVRETVLTYPLLAGMGITAGENMKKPTADFSKEKWLWQTYGEGIRDALKLQPDRQFRLIHRFHMTGLDEVLDEWKQYPGPFDFSFKYAIAHMYSTPNPPFIKEALPHLSPKLRTWLTVRNDDIYSFRWGDPEFARAFVRNMPGPDKMAGFYMGPDGYCWGREFLSTEPETPRQLVMKKQWYSFMLWGRLSFDPNLPDGLFQKTLATRFPEVPADGLFEAWATASKIFPQITRFHWGDIDIRWFPEACKQNPDDRGFYTVRQFIEGQTMPGSGILTILQYRQRVLNDQPTSAVTPVQVAEALRQYAAGTLKMTAELRPRQGDNKELRLTLGDLEAMAHLGNYYSQKILGAVDLALFDATGKAEQKTSAVKHLEAALEHWRQYSRAYVRQNRQPVLYNRVGWVDIPRLTAKVQEDIEMARAWQAGTIKGQTDRGADTPFRK